MLRLLVPQGSVVPCFLPGTPACVKLQSVLPGVRGPVWVGIFLVGVVGGCVVGSFLELLELILQTGQIMLQTGEGGGQFPHSVGILLPGTLCGAVLLHGLLDGGSDSLFHGGVEFLQDAFKPLSDQ